jgi:hypothetical protein
LPDCHKDARGAKVWLNLIAEDWNIIVSELENTARRSIRGGHLMANQEHLAILKQGVRTWNKWRPEHGDIIPDLSKANLSEAELSGTNLSGADLSEANLTGADLFRAASLVPT